MKTEPNPRRSLKQLTRATKVGTVRDYLAHYEKYPVSVRKLQEIGYLLFLAHFENNYEKLTQTKGLEDFSYSMWRKMQHARRITRRVALKCDLADIGLSKEDTRPDVDWRGSNISLEKTMNRVKKDTDALGKPAKTKRSAKS